MPEPDPPSPAPPADGPSAMTPRPDRFEREIQLQNDGRYREVAARRLRPWLEALVEALAPWADTLSLRFVSDRQMRELNRTYRLLDKSTDVLSFPGDLMADDGTFPPGVGVAMPADIRALMPPDHPLSDLDEGEPLHLGDILISVPTARRQAARARHSVERELRILILHGLLHCLGYDHEIDDGTMDCLEDDLRQQWIDPPSASGPTANAGDGSAQTVDRSSGRS